MADREPSHLEAAGRVVATLCNAVSARSLYPARHPLAREPVEELVGSLRSFFAHRGAAELTLLLVDGELVVEGRAQRSADLQQRALRRALERSGVERLSLRAGLGWEELGGLVDALAGRVELEAGQHVVLGHVTLANPGFQEEGEGGRHEAGAESRSWTGSADEAFEEQQLAGLESATAAFRPEDARSLAELDRGIWRMLESFARGQRRFLLLAGLRQRSRGLHRHATSVCLHASALARFLGIEGQPLHDIALGALLHDSGVLELPGDVLRGAARGEQWARDALRRHPELGAARLATAEHMPELAVLIAYEHHVGWDGHGGYPRIGRRPGLGAQITAVADAWDLLLHSPRASADPTQSNPGQPNPTPPGARLGAARRSAAHRALGELSGTLLNPRLVDAFGQLMRVETEEG